VEKLLSGTYISLTITEYIPERSLSNVTFVKRPLCAGHILPSTRIFTVVRNPTNVMTVGKPLIRAQVSFSIREFTLERNPVNAVNVGRPSG
jgi:hypothetical protein